MSDERKVQGSPPEAIAIITDGSGHKTFVSGKAEFDTIIDKNGQIESHDVYFKAENLSPEKAALVNVNEVYSKPIKRPLYATDNTKQEDYQ